MPMPVVGDAYAALPPLRGEAYGVVGIVGRGYGNLPPVRGEAHDEVERAWPDDDDLALLLLAT
jgi:hypothetical protein